jgi:predicted RNA methylase
MSYLYVQGQQGMTLDERRNHAYTEALKQVITPDSVVLDLGAGLGIHGLLAAQLGAKRVYLVEPEDIIAVTQEIVNANGYGDRVHCLQGKIEDVHIPEPVDIILSVFTGNFLLEEDLLPSLFYARDKYLKSGGALIPSAGVMEAAPVHNPEIYREEIEVWSDAPHGIVHTPARAYASQSVYYYRNKISQSNYLAEPQSLMELDFYTATHTNCKVSATYSVKTPSLCHGWAGWFKMKLGDTWLSTAPHEPPLHWSAAFLPLDPPLPVTADESITLNLQRPMGGDWTWTTQTTEARQQRSTFFALPMTRKTISTTTSSYKPQLSGKGAALLHILSHSNGTRSIQDLANDLLEKYAAEFKQPQDALQFVQGISKKYG